MNNENFQDTHQLAESMRRDAESIFHNGIKAADPYQAIKNSMQYVDDQLQFKLDLVQPEKLRTGEWKKIHLLAFGKAACAMIKAAQEIIPSALLSESCIAITNYENLTELDNINVIGASHPLPDLNGYSAARILAQTARQAEQGELVLVLISGGGSALIPYPVDQINLKEKRQVTKLLLGSGATINQINCVRKHLSMLKGGGLARLAAPADIHTLIMSDVIGNDVSAIASGPTVPDDTTFGQAIEVLKSCDIWEKTPENVKKFLQQGSDGQQPETPNSADQAFANAEYTIIGGNSISVEANIKFAKTLKYSSVLYGNALCGEAHQIAEKIAQYLKRLENMGIDRPYALLAGGETTVTLGSEPDKIGLGGRNQEMALAFALATEKLKLKHYWTFLSAGTDGIDGTTDAAGAVVNPSSIERMRRAGIDPEQTLQRHDAFTALKGSGDLILTGATGTNVADLQILLIYPLS